MLFNPGVIGTVCYFRHSLYVGIASNLTIQCSYIHNYFKGYFVSNMIEFVTYNYRLAQSRPSDKAM